MQDLTKNMSVCLTGIPVYPHTFPSTRMRVCAHAETLGLTEEK